MNIEPTNGWDITPGGLVLCRLWYRCYRGVLAVGASNRLLPGSPADN